jgi:hypothetical protein
MTLDACILEKAAFACFSNKLEDSFKRLLFLTIDKTVSDNPNITANKAYFAVAKDMAVNREDFNAAVLAMKTPFKRLAINQYVRSGQEFMHLNPTESNSWNDWVQTITENYPELSIWVNG